MEQINDAVASQEIELTEEEIRALQAPYTPRNDWQGVSDEANWMLSENVFLEWN